MTAIVEPLDPARHAPGLFDASHKDANPTDLWRYMTYPICDRSEDFRDWLTGASLSKDPLYFAIRDKDREAPDGMASYMRIVPDHRVIEIGAIWFGPQLQRTRCATEALYLMMRHAFDGLGYRRLEWKCDAANQASRRAAQRLGFTFEGIFHSHMIVKGRNRDTAWFSIIDEEWPDRRRRLESWLSPQNFDESGFQRAPLSTYSNSDQ